MGPLAWRIQEGGRKSDVSDLLRWHLDILPSYANTSSFQFVALVGTMEKSICGLKREEGGERNSNRDTMAA